MKSKNHVNKTYEEKGLLGPITLNLIDGKLYYKPNNNHTLMSDDEVTNHIVSVMQRWFMFNQDIDCIHSEGSNGSDSFLFHTNDIELANKIANIMEGERNGK